ncbi:hypothetical protein TNCV_3444951 [Trichonephila clavipes]|nr:hypothetical protein TNCV_3444951 [Trichonephila clavipes]
MASAFSRSKPHFKCVGCLLGRQVAGRNYPPTNKNTLIRALTEKWDKLPQQLLDNVVQSMAAGRKQTNENETRVTSGGPEGKSKGKEGLTAPKRVPGTPKRSEKKNAAICFSQPGRFHLDFPFISDPNDVNSFYLHLACGFVSSYPVPHLIDSVKGHEYLSPLLADSFHPTVA